jgi:hypothetical protein
VTAGSKDGVGSARAQSFGEALSHSLAVMVSLAESLHQVMATIAKMRLWPVARRVGGKNVGC